MKRKNLIGVLLFLIVAFSIASCNAVAGIFNAGVGFGIFMVIAIIIVIVFMAMKSRKK